MGKLIPILDENEIIIKEYMGFDIMEPRFSKIKKQLKIL